MAIIYLSLHGIIYLFSKIKRYFSDYLYEQKQLNMTPENIEEEKLMNDLLWEAIFEQDISTIKSLSKKFKKKRYIIDSWLFSEVNEASDKSEEIYKYLKSVTTSMIH
jgi:hypothetical protein